MMGSPLAHLDNRHLKNVTQTDTNIAGQTLLNKQQPITVTVTVTVTSNNDVRQSAKYIDLKK